MPLARQVHHRLLVSLIAGLVLCLTALFSGSAAPAQKAQQQEESLDYFQRWLNQDVVWIISDEELSVFQKLSTAEEKEQFIEQFWQRRDPDPTTINNEFKEEHYRRLAYVNEHFTSGAPGWRTDRGRIYIIHGPPNQIEKHTFGQSYERPLHEGGGRTATLPFETWWYRHIEGLGDDIELEFVDPTGSGEFRLARNPWEKDALLLTPNGGPTLAEAEGMMSRAQHPAFQPDNLDTYPAMAQRAKDNPFIRYETLARSQSAPVVKYKDLKQLVDVNIRYDSLPFQLRDDYFQLNDQQVLVPLTIELANHDLSFQEESGSQVARVAVYGLVTSMTNRFVTEFEDDLVLGYAPGDFDAALTGSSVYQKVISVAGPMRYKLDLVVKDLNSGNTGMLRRGLIPPGYKPDQLGTSSLLVSDDLKMLGEIPDGDEMFVIGDVKVRPNLKGLFRSDRPVWAYFHVYGAQLDQSTLEPRLRIRLRLLRDGDTVRSVEDTAGQLVQYASAQRAVVIGQVSLDGLPQGRYTLQVDILDTLNGAEVSREARVEVVSDAAIASR